MMQAHYRSILDFSSDEDPILSGFEMELKYKGITKKKEGSYVAQIRIGTISDYFANHIGTYTTEKAAAKAYDSFIRTNNLKRRYKNINFKNKDDLKIIKKVNEANDFVKQELKYEEVNVARKVRQATKERLAKSRARKEEKAEEN